MSVGYSAYRYRASQQSYAALLFATDAIAWSWSVTVGLGHDSEPCKKLVKGWRWRLGCERGWAQGIRNHVLDSSPYPHTWIGQFWGRNRAAQNVPGHVRRQEQNRYVWMLFGCIPDGSAHWCNLANTTEPSVCYAAAMRPYVKLLRPLVQYCKKYCNTFVLNIRPILHVILPYFLVHIFAILTCHTFCGHVIRK